MIRSILDRIYSVRIAILISAVILASVSVIYYVQITVRQVEEELPLRVMQEKRAMETVTRNFYNFLLVTDAALVHPTKGNLESVRENLSIIEKDLRGLRDLYTFDTLIGASALHAVLSPAIDDISLWLDQGFGSLPPSSPTVLQLVATRARDTLNKAFDKTTEADRIAYEILERQTASLRQLRNRLFVPILALVVLALGVIWLVTREQRAAKSQAEAEAAKLRAQSQLRAAIESISEGFSLYDSDDRLVISNTRYRELLHAGDSDIMKPGTEFQTIIQQAADRGFIDDAKVDKKNWLAMRMKRHQKPGEPHIQRYHGGRWIRVSERRTDDGGTVGVYTDITELKLREEELAQLVQKLEIARDQAETATRTKSQFLANMSHELRTPLNAVIGIADMLLEDARDQGQEDLLEPLERIGHAGTHLLNLINDILDLSKVEAGKMELHHEYFDGTGIISDAITTARTLAEKNENTIIVDGAEPVGEIFTDITRFRQIVLNLLSNACKFTQKGTITLKTELQKASGNDQLMFSVADTGIGMTQVQIDGLFQEFSQADSSTTRKFGGTGLGLAISHRLSRLLGGDIEVESKYGEGSTFTLRLPVTAPPESSRDAPPSERLIEERDVR